MVEVGAPGGVAIAACDPASAEARSMMDALWAEIQERYGFEAPNPMEPGAFRGPVGGFWLATADGEPVGSVAVTELDPSAVELDVMYVAPPQRGTGVAAALLTAAEEHARALGMRAVRLRAGEPQPEALRFYAKQGYLPIAAFGKWTEDESARCFEKQLAAPSG